jgi:predicted amidohydrolase
MKIAVIQHVTAWEDRDANFNKVTHLLDSVQSQQPELVCVPEMFSTGISKNVERVVEPSEGPTFQFLQRLARERSMWVHGTYAEAAPGESERSFNTSIVFDRRGRVVSRYHKVHPFRYGGEDKLYVAGSTLPVFGLNEFQACTPICYDLRFPELFRRAMREGCNLYIVPANWPTVRVQHWRSLAVARAIENLSWVVAINRCGEGGGLTYPGSSLVINPLGEIVLDLDEREQIGLADIDLDAATAARERFGFLHDVRGDLFPDLFTSPAPVS